MITYVERRDLDTNKYDTCIANSSESKVFAFSWYLDIVADNWAVLVLEDYKAVMPIPYRKKYTFKYVYPPFWLLELGVFSQEKLHNFDPFLIVLMNKFKYGELRLNTKNHFNSSSTLLFQKDVQKIAIQVAYEEIYEQYRKDRKKDLRKAEKANLKIFWDNDASTLIELFQNNVGKRTPSIKANDYLVLNRLIKKCIDKNVGELLTIKNQENEIVASGFFLKHQQEITILVSSTNFKNRKNGENTFMIDAAIKKYHKEYSIFNFGGSSMPTVAKYFLSFGAHTQHYDQLRFNKLPFFIKYFKSI